MFIAFEIQFFLVEIAPVVAWGVGAEGAADPNLPDYNPFLFKFVCVSWLRQK